MTFKRLISMITIAATFTLPAAAQSPVDGTWQGTLDVGVAKLRLVFQIATAPSGLSATLQSPDQSPARMPVSSITQKADVVTIEIAKIGGSFKGKLSADGASLNGTWTQGGQPFPLALSRSTMEAAAPKRPQTPVRPFPYKEENVTYANGHNTLAGTLTIPAGKGPFPAVLLIAGSGPNDRDETIMGHKLFLVLADHLTRQGIVVLRADKRGVGKSTGDLATATTADYASDAERGIAFLKGRPEVDVHRIGLIGHSEGGTVAPMVAARNHDVAFVVMMAGPGLPGAQVIAEQTRLLSLAAGASAEVAEKNTVAERKLLAVAAQPGDPAARDAELRSELAAQMPEARVDAAVKALTSPWYVYFLNYDPATALAHVTCPVLAIDGSKDLQVPPAQNLPAIRAALTAAGNTHFEIEELPGLNHLFQTAKTGNPNEYSTIEETISPVALDKITAWILKQS